MRIGVDIDGVIANVLPIWLERLNSAFNKNISVRAGMSFDLAAEYGLTYAQLEEFYRENESLFIEESEPIPGAANYLSMLMDHHRIYLVSARNPHQFDRTLVWLARHKIPFNDLMLLGKTDKRQTCLEYSLDIFVEDSPANALQLAGRGIPVLLLDAPYNQVDLPANVERCYSWADIYNRIMARHKS